MKGTTITSCNVLYSSTVQSLVDTNLTLAGGNTAVILGEAVSISGDVNMTGSSIYNCISIAAPVNEDLTLAAAEAGLVRLVNCGSIISAEGRDLELNAFSGLTGAEKITLNGKTDIAGPLTCSVIDAATSETYLTLGQNSTQVEIGSLLMAYAGLDMQGSAITKCNNITSSVNSNLVLSGGGTGYVSIPDSLNVNVINSSSNTDLSLTALGTGVVRISDTASISGGLDMLTSNISNVGTLTGNASQLSLGSRVAFVSADPAQRQLLQCDGVTSSPDTDLTLTATGAGVVRISDSASISGGLDMKNTVITNCNTISSASGVDLTLTAPNAGRVFVNDKLVVANSVNAQTLVSPDAAIPVRLFRSYALGTLQQIVGTTPTYLLPGTGFGTRTLPAFFITNGMTFRMRYRAKQNSGNSGNMLFTLALKNTLTNIFMPLSVNTNTVSVVAQVNQAFGFELVWSFSVVNGTVNFTMGYLTVDREGQVLRLNPMDPNLGGPFSVDIPWEVNVSYATTTANATNNLTAYLCELDVI